MTAVNPTRPAHYPALDGVRGLAILLVVFYHNFRYFKLSYIGWAGVDLFFVLSGFLITGILISEAGSPHYLRNFFARRVLRIFPLYYLSLIILLIIFPALGLFKSELNFFIEHQVWLWTYTQNWLYAFYPDDSAVILTHFWSLAAEEQFYLVWPFLILLIRKPSHLFFIVLAGLLLLIAARCIVWMLHLNNFNYTALYTFTRVDGIFAGSMIALLHHFKPRFLPKYGWIVLTGIVLLNLIFYITRKYAGNDLPYFAVLGYPSLSIVFGLMVHVIVKNISPVVNRIFSIKALRFTGKISYGFYIFHWPVYLLTGSYFYLFCHDRLNLSTQTALIGSSLIVTALAFILSVISYFAFERYFLKLKENFVQ